MRDTILMVLCLIGLAACGNSGAVYVVERPCTVQSNVYGSLISCPDGTSAQVTNGINGNTVTPVKLCEGIYSYPNTFVEQAFCINGGLYAVYSANGGFLTYLPNGAYSSNGIGSACNLVVNGCTVSH